MLLPNGAFFDWDDYPLGTEVVLKDEDGQSVIIVLNDPDWGFLVDSRGSVQDIVYNVDTAINFSDPREGLIGVLRNDEDQEAVNFEYRLQANSFGISLPN